jgi:hypothetical protein
MKNKALLVGINKYPNPSNELRGCVNDILDVEHYIAETNKLYAKENIKKLTDHHATKKEIITGLKWLLAGAAPGDSLLFHYSGHGAQVPTRYPGLEQDGLDEIICPYDFDGSDATTLRDKEFAQLFASIPKEVHFVWISDSCHAEDLSRDLVLGNKANEMNGAAEMRYRYFHGLTPAMSKAINNPITKSLAPIIQPLNGALLSACASHELSADAIINNRFNGAFTYYLIQNLKVYGADKSMQEIISYVNVDLNKNGYDQNPQTEGLMEQKTFFI